MVNIMVMTPMVRKKNTSLRISSSSGNVEIGYIYGLIISAMVLTALTLATSGMITDTQDITARIQLEEVANKISLQIQDVVFIASNSPSASYVEQFKITKFVVGESYTIAVNNDYVYVNSTIPGLQVKVPIISSTISVGSYNVFSSRAGELDSISGMVKIKYRNYANEMRIFVTSR